MDIPPPPPSALPPSVPPSAPPPPGPPPWAFPPPPALPPPSAGSRMKRGKIIGAFVALVVITAVVTSLLAQVSKTPGAKAPCRRGRACGAPPTQSAGLHTLTTFTGGDLGFQVEYEPNLWSVAQQDGRNLILQAGGGAFTLWIQGAPASQTPNGLLRDRVRRLGDQIVGLSADTAAANQVLDPSIGYVDGVGEVLVGAVNSPQGPSSPVTVAVMAAKACGVTAVISVVTDQPNRKSAFQASDSVLNTFLFGCGQQ